MERLSLLTPAILLVGIVIGILHFKKYPGIAKLILGYFFVQLTMELLSRYFGFINAAKNNLFLFSVVAIVDVLFYSALYYFFILERKLNWLLGISVLVLVYLLFILTQKSRVPLTAFDSYEKVIADSLVCMFGIVAAFHIVMGKNKVNPTFMRINTAVLLYFSLDILISLTSNFLINAGTSFIIYFWLLRLILLLFLYSVLTTILWQLGKNPKQ